MKNKFIAALMLIAVAVFVTSCYSSRKQGCPVNVGSSNKPFRA